MTDPDFKDGEQPKGFRLMITQEFDGYFTVIHGEPETDPRLGAFKSGSSRRARKLTFGEMLEQVAKLGSRGEVKGRTYEESPAFLIKHGEVPRGYVAVILPKGEAERISNNLSDFLCWAAGFKAALQPDDLLRAPLGVEVIRDLRINLSSAIEKAEA